tara:strand:- start:5351 stop:5512 length:162 start_codon:yes stop_codon:yes gene_type:complete
MIDPKDVAIVTPGAIAVAASWLGIVNTVLSIAFISASLAFLIWKWRQAIKESK